MFSDGAVGRWGVAKRADTASDFRRDPARNHEVYCEFVPYINTITVLFVELWPIGPVRPYICSVLREFHCDIYVKHCYTGRLSTSWYVLELI
jgi:hypothetical protein